jgi:hypothetical protein
MFLRGRTDCFLSVADNPSLATTTERARQFNPVAKLCHHFGNLWHGKGHFEFCRGFTVLLINFSIQSTTQSY